MKSTATTGPSQPERNLTSEVRAADEKQRAAQVHPPRTQPRDILVVDDQPDLARGWFRSHLPGHTMLSVSSVDALERYLQGGPVPNLPPRDDGHAPPLLAMVDLDLRDPDKSGVSAVRLLSKVQGLTTILHTNELSGHRDLLAVLCAEAAGGGILCSMKTSSDGHRVQQLVNLLATKRDAGDDASIDGTVCGLPYIQAVTVKTGKQRSPALSLSEALWGQPWMPHFWERMEFSFQATDAFQHSLDRVGLSKGEGRRDWRETLGTLAQAWQINGRSFSGLRNGLLDLNSTAWDDSISGKPAQAVAAFSQSYGLVLTSPEVTSWD